MEELFKLYKECCVSEGTMSVYKDGLNSGHFFLGSRQKGYCSVQGQLGCRGRFPECSVSS